MPRIHYSPLMDWLPPVRRSPIETLGQGLTFAVKVLSCIVMLLAAIIVSSSPSAFAAPNAAFTANPTEGEAPLEVQFTDQSTPS